MAAAVSSRSRRLKRLEIRKLITARMRVIAGPYRSRILKSLKGLALRPTSDRLRETLFNVLAPNIGGSRFVDLFAGTGDIIYANRKLGNPTQMNRHLSIGVLIITACTAFAIGWHIEYRRTRVTPAGGSC